MSNWRKEIRQMDNEVVDDGLVDVFEDVKSDLWRI